MIRLVKVSEVSDTGEDWVLEGILSGLSLLFGPSGSKKSFLAVSWGAAVASGKSWHGHRTDPAYPTGAPVLYIIGEGGLGPVSMRIREALREIGAGEDVPFYAVPQAVVLGLTPNDMGPLREVIDLMDQKPRLIIIDTLSQCMPGDENKQEVMQGFVSNCNTLKAEYGCCVLVVHHSPASDDHRPRGSTVLISAADTAFCVESKAEHSRVKLTVKKLKDLSTSDFHPEKLDSVCVSCLDKNNLPAVDNMGGELTTLVLRAPPTDAEVCAEVFAGLAANRSEEQAVGYKEWKEAYCERTGKQEGMFKIARTAILDDPKYGIMQHSRGQYVWEGATPTQPGENYNSTEEVRRIEAFIEAREREEER